MNVTAVKYDAILRAVSATPWAIDQLKGKAIMELLALRASGGKIAEEDVRVIAAANRQPTMKVKGAVAVLPVYGVIAPRMNMMTDMSGGTSMELLGAQLDAALDDPAVGAILLDFDSPGGTVQGVPELAAKILAGRDRKPIIAAVNHLAASAGYWLAAQCSEIVMSPSAEAGSIGVFTVHFDESAALEDAGVKATVIKSGKFKAEGNPYEPLSDESKAHVQDHIDGIYNEFVHAVAKGRGVAVADVRNDYGQGRTLTAKQAVQVGMADRVSPIEAVLAQLSGGKGVRRKIAASAEPHTFTISAPSTITASAIAGAMELTGLTHPGGITFIAGSTGADPEGNGINDDESETPPPTGKKKKKPANPDDTSDGTPADEQSRATTDGAVVGSIPTPPTEPAPKAKENTVDTTTAAQTGAAPESSVGALMALATEHKKGLTDVNAWFAAGKTPDQVKAELLKEYSSRATPIVSGVADRSDGHEFKNAGENIYAIIQAGRPGGFRDPRLTKINNRVMASASGMNESVGSEGGFFLQPEYLPGVLTPVYADDPILSRIRRIPIGGPSNSIKYRVVNETSRANGSRWGGISTKWGAEADAPTSSMPKTRLDELALNKLLANAYLTDELTADAPAAQALVLEAFQTELRFVLADVVWRGDGAGQPLGILNSGAIVTQAIESGQTKANSNASIASNVAKMLMSIPASLWSDVIFLYNQELLPTFVTAVIGTGGSAFPVFLGAGGISGKPYDTILGHPAFPSEMAEAPGTPGDLMAIAPSQYLLGEKGGPQMAQSLHVRFLNDELTLRITMRVGGQPVWKQAVTPYKGATSRSPFVNLATRS